MSKSLTADISKIDGLLLLTLKGKVLEDSIIKELLAKLDKELKLAKGQLILDASGLDYINSTGIQFFIKALTKARVQGGDLIFFGITGSVKTIFELSKMDEVFTIVASLEEAKLIFKEKK